jgi:hypothetical protein
METIMQRIVVGISAFAFLALCAGSATADVVIQSPNVPVPGNSNNGFPFNISDFGLSSQRYQQVYAASDFSSLPGPSVVKQLLFSPAQSSSGSSVTMPNIQIDLSTTASGPDGLSGNFASNVGADDTVVYAGPLTLTTAGTPGVFDMVITLQNPFTYDPTKGNLLLDVRNFAGGGDGGNFNSQISAQYTLGDTVSRAYTYSSGVNSPNADGTDTLGLITQFDFAPANVIPEPASLTLLSLGALGMLGYARRRWKRLV